MNTKEKVNIYFNKVEAFDSNWTCKCGKELRLKTGTRWTNLFNHVKSIHTEYIEYNTSSTSTQQPITQFSGFTHIPGPIIAKSADNMYSWIEWVTCGLKPFSYVENSLTQKYSKLENFSIKTMKKNMSLLTERLK